MSTQGIQQAGWYPNPMEPGESLRYWNGSQWTHSTLSTAGADGVPAPRGPQVEHPASQPTSDREISQQRPAYDAPPAPALSSINGSLINRRARTSGTVGDVFTFFALFTLVVGLGGAVVFGVWSFNVLGSQLSGESILVMLLIVLGSLSQYAFLRLGSVVAYYIRDRYQGNIG